MTAIHPELTIRHAAAPDIHIISNMHLCALRNELSCSCASSFRSADDGAIDDISTIFNEAISDEHSCLLVATTDVIVGYIYIYERKTLAEIPRSVGCINGIYVIDELRGAGVANRLMTESFTWFKKRGTSIIELNATIGNCRAESFWKRWGFKPLEQVLFHKL